MNKILLLEDDPLLAKSLIKFLSKNGYTVDWAKDGNEALSLSYNNKYKLYLFDINVPLINGDDLLKELRVSQDFTPCILVTALVDLESISKGFISGADDYIKKPFEPNELLIRIKSKTNQLKKSIKYKDYELFVDEDRILYQNEELFLTKLQKNLLSSLILDYPNPSIKDRLMEFFDSDDDLSLRVTITKLKQKLSINIINIRGVGYKLD